jgi:bacterioferritin (cytochrome b1)
MDQVASRNDLDIIAKKIIDFCKSHQEGVQDDELSKILNIPEELRINILNQLV